MQVVVKTVQVSLDLDAVYRWCDAGGIHPTILHKHIHFNDLVGEVQAKIDALTRSLNGELLYLNFNEPPSYEKIIEEVEEFLIKQEVLGDFKSLQGILKISRMHFTTKDFHR